MGLDLADLDKWNPDAIHSVFQAAIDRARGVRSTATSVGNVLDATPWEGEAYDAAVQANGKIRQDLIRHATACDAVGRAAATAEAQVRAIKDDWRRVQRMADQWGITIHVETGQLSYIDPGTAETRNEMEHRVDILESEIRSLMAPPPTIPHSPGGFDPPIYQPMPDMTFLPPSNLTPLGPVNAPRIVRIDDPTVTFPQPPLR